MTWLAEGPGGARVAVKELRITGDAKAAEMIRREADVLRTLHHPNIPDYHEDFPAGSGRQKTHCVVQEWIEGKTLAQEIAEKRFSLEDAIEVLEEILVPLTYLHGLSPPVVHRDLKPANLIVRQDGSIALVDFGAVRDAWKGTLGGSTVAGTFGYMSPEQFAGDASPASDVYALGALLVALLGRVEPASLQTRAGALAWRNRVRVAPEWDAFIASLLHPDPAARPPDAMAVTAEIARARRGVIPATTTRPPALVVIGGALAAFVGLAIGLALLVSEDDPEASSPPPPVPRTAPERPIAPWEPLPRPLEARSPRPHAMAKRGAEAHLAVVFDPVALSCVAPGHPVDAEVRYSRSGMLTLGFDADVPQATADCLREVTFAPISAGSEGEERVRFIALEGSPPLRIGRARTLLGILGDSPLNIVVGPDDAPVYLADWVGNMNLVIDAPGTYGISAPRGIYSLSARGEADAGISLGELPCTLSWPEGKPDIDCGETR